MRYSKLFGKTSKTEGTDLKATSHRLLIQAGFVRESTAGRYYFLPLGLRVHHKIVDIVRRHMDAAGAQELVTPTLHPLELWQETNRDNAAGFELMQVEDRRGAQFALGGTAEEMIVDVVRKFNVSYKELPFNVYQFSLKFRDELRARGGLLRVREFVMKDAYSFSTEEQFDGQYKLMRDTYTNIFSELGLKTRIAEADGGYIGGDYCHEFIVDSEAGESTYFVEDGGDYVAHEDVAVFKKHQEDGLDEEEKPYEEVEGKGIIGVDELAKFLRIPVEKTTKTILFETDSGELVAAAVSGLYDINETKLINVLGCNRVELASEEKVREITGAELGYAGFIGLPDHVRVILDESVAGRKNFECGANRTDYHSINANFGRDYPLPEKFYDIAVAKDGCTSLNGKKMIKHKGIEVGNIFQLGYHYSNLMRNAEYTDEQGKRQKYYMGCYGIGIGRTMAAIVEVHSDEKGIAWPVDIAPYHVYLATIGDVAEQTEKLYEDMQAAGIEVLYDDRDVRPGEKFADADLLGMPFRLVLSDRTLEADSVELKVRTETEVSMIKIGDVISWLKEKVD